MTHQAEERLQKGATNGRCILTELKLMNRPRPSFKSPPLVEVVCGVRFRPLSAFEAPHYGLFWKTIQKGYPRSRTVASLSSGNQIEVRPNEPAEVTVQLSINAPDMPRVWFISADDTRLVQLQPDRFLFNWREGPERAKYPRYPAVIGRFKTLYGTFEKFLKDNKLGNLSLLSAELSYINHIKPGAGWSDLGDIGEVFPDFSWRRGNRVVTPPVNFNFRSNHVLAGGRLSVTVQTARSTADQSQLLRFDLTVRGEATDFEKEGMWKWYDAANISIVDSFTDLTSTMMQKDVWKRAR